MDEYVYDIEVDGETEELTVPANAVDLLSEEDETPATVGGDLILLGLGQQLHGAIHHSAGETDEELLEAESALDDVFEDRFGATFGDLMGHDH